MGNLKYRALALAATLIALFGSLTMVSSAHAQLPPGALLWGSGFSVYMQPCNDSRYTASQAVTYAYGVGLMHSDFTSVYGIQGTALESNESRCINAYTGRMRVWISNPQYRLACKYWADEINYGITSTITREWCGGF